MTEPAPHITDRPLPPADETIPDFTFEKSFSVVAYPCGGYTLDQPDFLNRDKQPFRRAFSNVDDLADFLISEKRKYMQTWSTGEIIRDYPEPEFHPQSTAGQPSPHDERDPDIRNDRRRMNRSIPHD